MKKKVLKALAGVNSEEYKQYVIKRAEQLSDLGISNEEDLRKFCHISQLVPIFVRRATNKSDKNVYSIVASYVFDNNVNNITSLQKKVIECLSDFGMVKKAYPQDVNTKHPMLTFDTQRWIKALNDINMKRRLFGLSKDKAIESETKGWTDMELEKFKHWVKYYEQGNNFLYPKTAQTYTTEGGISVPFSAKAIQMDSIPGLYQREQDESRSIQTKLEEKETNKNEVFNKIRASILSRINSAKKLISSEGGRNFVKEEYEKLLDSLMKLEKDLLVLKNASVLPDIVARAENTLITQGYKKAAYLFIKIAQEENPFGGEGDFPPPPPPLSDSEDKPDVKEQIIETLNSASSSVEENKMPTNAEIEDEIKKEEKEEAEETEITPPKPDLPEPPNQLGGQPSPEPTKTEKPLAQPHLQPVSESLDPAESPEPSMTEKEGEPEQKTARYQWANYKTAELKKLEIITNSIANIFESTKQIYKTALEPTKQRPLADKYFQEDVLEKAFSGIKVSDVVKRLQALSKVFKNREIARQLSIIDLMLDRLGIAGLFPQLAEATKSALESNQYSSIRIEEILSKLMSVMDEHGNVNIQIKQEEQKPSLIDEEMEKALRQPTLTLEEDPTTSSEKIMIDKGDQTPGIQTSPTPIRKQPVSPSPPITPPIKPIPA